MILGASKELLEGDRVFYEFEIFFVENDQVVVRPRPRGEASVVFELAYLDREGQRARFENLEHDFPQQLEYHRDDAHTLILTVSGPGAEAGTIRGFQLVLKESG